MALGMILVREAAHPALWVQAVAAGAGDLATSAGVALLAAMFACLLALAISRSLCARPGRLWWLVSLPLAMPSALAGAGLIWLWNRDLPVPVYGTFWMLVLASLARFAPIAVLALAVWRSRLDPALLEAAAVFGSPARAFFRVELPLLSPGIAAGAAAVFVLSLAELGASLLVAPPGRGTLALRIFNYLHYGASVAVAALALCLMAATASVMLIAAKLWKVQR
jgi:iron(III) transport system permease protein